MIETRTHTHRAVRKDVTYDRLDRILILPDWLDPELWQDPMLWFMEPPYSIDMHYPIDEVENPEIFPVEILDSLDTAWNLEVTLHEDPDKQYHQLLHWLMIQSYWYYVLDNPQVNNATFDLVKVIVREIERECWAALTVGRVWSHLPLGMNHTRNWYNPFLWLPCRYPEEVQQRFRRFPIHMNAPWMREFEMNMNRSKQYTETFRAREAKLKEDIEKQQTPLPPETFKPVQRKRPS